MFTQADNKCSGTNKIKIDKKIKQSIAWRRKTGILFINVLLQSKIQLKIDICSMCNITHEHMYELNMNIYMWCGNVWALFSRSTSLCMWVYKN